MLVLNCKLRQGLQPKNGKIIQAKKIRKTWDAYIKMRRNTGCVHQNQTKRLHPLYTGYSSLASLLGK